ncbi:D-alanyl-D-alanine carboxypeptidase family protein [Bacillus sp. FSL W7-1360]
MGQVKQSTRTLSRIFLSLLVLITVFGSKVAAAEPIKVDGAAAIIIDANSGQVLFEQGSDEQLPIASMTKLMSEYLILEAIKEGKIAWDDEVAISVELATLSHKRALSNVPLRQDYAYTVKDLYESMAIYSANASTMALATHVAGSEKSFVGLMNEKAAELGLEKYEFVNASGLNNADLGDLRPEGTEPNGETSLSARSVAKLAYYLLRDYPEVLETASIPFAEFNAGPDEKVDMPNWNEMLPGADHEYSGIDGLKTGYTSAAGNNFTATAKRGDTRLITVVMGTDTRADRFNETAKLLDYGFNHFDQEILLEKGAQPDKGLIEVAVGKEKEVQVVTKDDVSLLFSRQQDASYTTEIKLDEDKLDDEGRLVAPLKKGEKVGTLKISLSEPTSYIDGDELQVDLVTANEVEKAGWFTLTMRGIGGFFSGLWTGLTDWVGGLFS